MTSILDAIGAVFTALSLLPMWLLSLSSTSITATNPLSTPFNESLARSFMLPLSSAAYSDDPQKCLTSQLKTTKRIEMSKQVTINCDIFHWDHCSGFTFYDESRRVIGISFRGTNDYTQLIPTLTNTLFDEKVEFQDGGRISKYFSNAYNGVWNGGLGADFTALAAKYPNYTVWVTGHSLGGALGSLASLHISAQNIVSKDKIVLYTFGQPRTGDQKYADAHDKMVSSFRIAHGRDAIVHLPPLWLGYKHHAAEVWYNDGMSNGDSYVVCEKQEDSKCSDMLLLAESADDHLHYYGRKISQWGYDGCPS